MKGSWATARERLPKGLRRLPILAGFALRVPLAFGGFRVMNYTQDDPSFCRSCHTMQKAWDKWATSVHREVNCHSCHEQNPIESAELVIQYVTARPNHVKKHAGISDDACLKCHANGNANGDGDGMANGNENGNGNGESEK